MKWDEARDRSGAPAAFCCVDKHMVWNTIKRKPIEGHIDKKRAEQVARSLNAHEELYGRVPAYTVHELEQ